MDTSVHTDFVTSPSVRAQAAPRLTAELILPAFGPPQLTVMSTMRIRSHHFMPDPAI